MTKIGTLWVLWVLPVIGHAFNLEGSSPVIKVGAEDSYFGFSVAQHRPVRNPDYGQSLILVGAPRDQNLQPQTNRSGALWRCPLTSQWQVKIINPKNGTTAPPRRIVAPPQLCYVHTMWRVNYEDDARLYGAALIVG